MFFDKTKETKCCYCRKNIGGKYEKSTKEHLTPKSKNKNNESRKLILPCCGRCNKFRKNKRYKNWSIEIQWIIDNEPRVLIKEKYGYAKEELIKILRNMRYIC